jgi:hypothetical protein
MGVSRACLTGKFYWQISKTGSPKTESVIENARIEGGPSPGTLPSGPQRLFGVWRTQPWRLFWLSACAPCFWLFCFLPGFQEEVFAREPAWAGGLLISVGTNSIFRRPPLWQL